MDKSKVKQPLFIFVSSKIGGKYNKIRDRISELMSNSPLMEPYIYEIEGASSINSRESYVSNLERSDLFVCIIDNEDGVSNSVQFEIDKAKKMNKKCLYYFCSETSSTSTQLQKDLDGAFNPKYAVVDRFEEIPDRVINDVYRDLVSIYRIKNLHPEVELADINSLGGVESANSIYSVKGFLKTNIVSNFIMKKIDLRFEDINDYSKIEEDLLSFFRAAIGLERVDSQILENLRKEIINRQDEVLRDVINLRFKALDAYLKGDFDNTISILSETLQKSADDINIPLWLANNIAIDLRNVTCENDELKNKFSKENKGQEFIDNRKEEIYFPLLDRKEKLLYDKLDKIYFESQYSNAHFNLQNMGIFKLLEEIFIIALTYGSITHISIFIDDIIYTLNILNRVYSDYEIQKELIRLLVIKGSRRTIEKCDILESQLFISANDIDQVISSIKNIPTFFSRFQSELLFMIEFSDYVSDDIFEIEVSTLLGNIITWLQEVDSPLNLESDIFRFLFKIINRVDSRRVIPIIDIVFNNHLRRFYRNTYDLMGKIRYGDLSDNDQEKILKYLVRAFEENVECNPYDKFGIAIIRFTKQATIDFTSLENIVKIKFEKFYKEEYLLEHLHEKHGEEFVTLLLNNIHNDNVTQGVDGCYSYGGNNDYGTIINLIKHDQLILSKTMLNRAVEVCMESLSTNTQKIETQISAIQLLILLFSNQRNTVNWHEDIVNEIKKIDFDVMTIHESDFFNTGNTKSVLKVSVKLFLSIFDKKFVQSFVNQLLTIRIDRISESKRILEVITHFVECCVEKDLKNEVLNAIVYYSTYLLNSKYVEQQIIAIYSLINLSKFECVRELTLNQISVFWDTANSEVKKVVIYNIEKISATDEFKKYLLGKAKLDNHYRVRELATEK
ncbi:hypothetical protein SGGBAA2069_c18100 [Streptococcus gallolyticus subsp. gallolyticus ATCC BAA-2069]|uniref:hypothetical protein n=1 Tax=Streptococcus gallolyticus TaxID=315405 RepID=UPI000201AF26|nr:hypothetical protein [Streptococcus gallolyticus]CBZ48982.1 hypothetical protein SGGBAA2069_c18100 [Streptococcus gallolyticus subsp. gallolyticus ATCC BAA-2069]